ncbi:MAG: VanW family protein [Patescibacteria group bacterium]
MKHLFRKYRKHIWVYIAIASIAFLFSLQILRFRFAQIGLIYPNVYIGDINFGNKAPEEAKQILDKEIQTILENGLSVSIKEKDLKFSLFEYANDPDLSRELIKTNVADTVDSLYSVGRSHFNIAANLRDTIISMVSKTRLKANIESSEKNLTAYLERNLKEFETPAKNATVEWEGDEPKIKNEVVGLKINYPEILNRINGQLQALQEPYLAISLVPDQPQIRKFEIEDRLPEIKQALSRAPFTIKYGKKEWAISKNDLKKYLDFEKQNGVAILSLSKEKTEPLFSQIAKEINTPAQDARFEIKDGRVTEFQTSQLGLALDVLETTKALNSILLDGYPILNAIVVNSSPEITNGDVNQLGISEILGTGTSNFAGSPPNRIHNIKTGAQKINGLLIKPGEEFSLIKALGEINGEAGFKQELVIKEGRTVPEYGGGLCQIGTTVFRAALASGLPITERKNHSYRVAYYEPAGTDATIYNPSPDLKFKNDTSGYVLIQTKINGNELVFDFWGKKDGREVTITKPVVYNIVSPPATKYIPTTELAPGQKKKLESAHSGADTYFKYTVKYNDERGEVNKTFSSHYRPWAEVWLVGANLTADASITQ